MAIASHFHDNAFNRTVIATHCIRFTTCIGSLGFALNMSVCIFVCIRLYSVRTITYFYSVHVHGICGYVHACICELIKGWRVLDPKRARSARVVLV